MAFAVVLDTNVVLAACLDPGMDPKAGMAKSVFDTLGSEGLRPRVTESIGTEIDAKVRERVGQLLEAVRTLANGPPAFPLDPARAEIDLVEDIFARLRRETRGAAATLQLLETRLEPVLTTTSISDGAQWRDLMTRITSETARMLAEVQRRQALLGLESLARAGRPDHEKFRGIVDTSDLEHIAILAAISEAKAIDILFVTMDGRLHGARQAIAGIAPRLIVTTPTYLRRQIARLRARR